MNLKIKQGLKDLEEEVKDAQMVADAADFDLTRAVNWKTEADVMLIIAKENLEKFKQINKI